MGIISEEKILKEAEKSAFGVIFEDGAYWAQDEYVNSLWHDYTELPDFKQPIIYTFKCDFNSIQSLNCPNKDSFNAVFKAWGEFKWAYSKDILPKEYFKI